MTVIQELESPRVVVGDQSLRDRIKVPPFGMYFLDYERESLEQWDGYEWVHRGRGKAGPAGETKELKLGRFGIEGGREDAAVAGGNEAAADSRSGGGEGYFASGLGGGGGTGGAGGTAVGPAHVAGDPPLAGPGSEITIINEAFTGAIQGGAGAYSPDLPAAGTLTQITCWSITRRDSDGYITGNGQLTIPAARPGNYRVKADLELESTGAADDREIELLLYIDGVVAFSRVWPFSGAHGVHCDFDVEGVFWGLVGGNVITIWGRTFNSATAMSPLGVITRSRLVIEYLGP